MTDGRTPLPTVQAAGDGRWASQAEGVSAEQRLCPALPPEGMEQSRVDGEPTLGRGGKLGPSFGNILGTWATPIKPGASTASDSPYCIGLFSGWVAHV